MIVPFWVLVKISRIRLHAGYSYMLHSFIAQHRGCLILVIIQREPDATWIKAHQIKNSNDALDNTSFPLKASGILKCHTLLCGGHVGSSTEKKTTRHRGVFLYKEKDLKGLLPPWCD